MRILACAAFALLLISCGGPGPASGPAPATLLPAGTPPPAATDLLSIKPGDTLRAQLRLGPLAPVAIHDEIHVAARVEVNENHLARIGSPVAGRIASLTATVGQRVRRGDMLAQVSSPALSEGQLAFLRALTQEQVSRRAVERADALLRAEVIGTAELQRRQAELAEAEASRDAARDQLLLLGMPADAVARLEKDRRLESTARLAAALDGTVLRRNVTVGQIVQPADSVYEVADLSTVWLTADVPASDAADLHVGQRVTAAIGTPAAHRLQGRLDYVSATVEPETRTVRVRMTVPNPTGSLRPSALATMTLYLDRAARPCVPLTAVVLEESREHVFVQTAPGEFQLRPVQLEAERQNCRPLAGGLDKQDVLVLDGAFHLNNERRRRAQRSSGGEP